MRTFTLFLVLILSASTFSYSDNKALHVAVDNYYPPFVYIDEKTGELTGFDVDIAKTVCKHLKRECEIIVLPLEEIIPNILAGKIDMGVAGMTKSRQREDLVFFPINISAPPACL